ncbi:MAG TPA: O-acetylhomoserine aminocarboxypropyltransferase/cysteine synthase [bacterium]|nr:O-acetylhomoserine aminocarboxypropyltransferase/cysteine synthase [bacterium]HOL47124.1 O-acetylhomoserine aminocarboxypropyltransferase/cysteine synthase [bacterium]HPQ18878.1 O-acetylhomoserine aminocarboxypropyltransferase/cysteine synthase [bacterium]
MYEFETMLIHGGLVPQKNRQSTTVPIYQTTSFKYESCEDISEVFKGEKYGFIYTRISNPTIEILEKRMALIEDGIGAIATSSGMSAITTTIMTLCKSGDNFISSSSIFGGTYSLFKNRMKEFGINCKFINPNYIERFEKEIDEKTKAIFIETIGNPKIDVADIRAISRIAEKYEVPLIVDSTITTPYLIQPKNFGANIIIHSTSKFINGFGNSIGGIIIDAGNFNWNNKRFQNFKEFYEKYGQLAFLIKVRKEIFRDFGGCISPFNTFLILNGLETLSLRMTKHCENGMKLANFLKEQKEVLFVNYPGLKENKYYHLAKEQFNNKFGSIISFGLKNKEMCFKFINSLKLAYNLANLGDAKTLIIHPASTICVEFNEEEKRMMGVSENLIRVSVGLESINDIINDFKNAFLNLNL